MNNKDKFNIILTGNGFDIFLKEKICISQDNGLSELKNFNDSFKKILEEKIKKITLDLWVFWRELCNYNPVLGIKILEKSGYHSETNEEFLDDFKEFLIVFLSFWNCSEINDLEKALKSFFTKNQRYIIFKLPLTILYVIHIFSIWNKNISELDKNFGIDVKNIEFFPDFFLTTNFTRSTKIFAKRLRRTIISENFSLDYYLRYIEIHNQQLAYPELYTSFGEFDDDDMFSFNIDTNNLVNDYFEKYQINIENKKINYSFDKVFNCIIKNNNIKNVNFEIFGKSPFNDDHIFENISYLKDKLKKLEINLFIMVNFLNEDEKHEFLRKAEIFNLNIKVQHYKKSWLNKIIIRKNRL